MSEQELEETHKCGTPLIRVSAGDAANPHDCPVVTCPACLEIVRRER